MSIIHWHRDLTPHTSSIRAGSSFSLEGPWCSSEHSFYLHAMLALLCWDLTGLTRISQAPNSPQLGEKYLSLPQTNTNLHYWWYSEDGNWKELHCENSFVVVLKKNLTRKKWGYGYMTFSDLLVYLEKCLRDGTWVPDFSKPWRAALVCIHSATKSGLTWSH